MRTMARQGKYDRMRVVNHLSASITAVEQDYHLARFDDLSGFGSH